MLAIYKRELRAYTNGVIGYAYMAFLLLFAGLICFYVNVLSGSSHFENTLEILAVLLILAMPVLGMQSFSAERRAGNARWLYSLPIRLYDVVLGKYLASLSIFSVVCVVLTAYPLLLRPFGMASLGVAYTSLLGFWLLGAAVLALCGFLSSLTEGAVASVLLSIGGTLLLYLFDLIASAISQGAVASVVSALSPFSRFAIVCDGAFDVTSVLYSVSFAAFFLYLTYQVMERKRRR